MASPRKARVKKPKGKSPANVANKPRPKGSMNMAAKKKSAKRKSAKKGSSKKAKGSVPLKVLEARAFYLNKKVKSLGGEPQSHGGLLTHRTPKQVGKLRAKKKRGKRGGKKKK